VFRGPLGLLPGLQAPARLRDGPAHLRDDEVKQGLTRNWQRRLGSLLQAHRLIRRELRQPILQENEVGPSNPNHLYRIPRGVSASKQNVPLYNYQ
jgi:hypothetical protein